MPPPLLPLLAVAPVALGLTGVGRAPLTPWGTVALGTRRRRRGGNKAVLDSIGPHKQPHGTPVLPHAKHLRPCSAWSGHQLDTAAVKNEPPPVASIPGQPAVIGEGHRARGGQGRDGHRGKGAIQLAAKQQVRAIGEGGAGEQPALGANRGQGCPAEHLATGTTGPRCVDQRHLPGGQRIDKALGVLRVGGTCGADDVAAATGQGFGAVQDGTPVHADDDANMVPLPRSLIEQKPGGCSPRMIDAHKALGTRPLDREEGQRVKLAPLALPAVGEVGVSVDPSRVPARRSKRDHGIRGQRPGDIDDLKGVLRAAHGGPGKQQEGEDMNGPQSLLHGGSPPFIIVEIAAVRPETKPQYTTKTQGGTSMQRSARFPLALVLLGLLGLLWPGGSPAATYYVSQTTGSAGNPCTGGSGATNPAFPKKTINQGISCLISAGDILVVAPGTYDETVTDSAGTGGYAVTPPNGSSWAAATTIKAAAGGTPTIQVSSPPGGWISVFFFSAADFLILDGFVLNGIPGRPSTPEGEGITEGINLEGTSRIRFKDITINYGHQQGVRGNLTNKEFLNVSMYHIAFDPVTGEDTCSTCGTFPCTNSVCHGYYGGSADTNVLIDGGIIDHAQGHGMQFYASNSTVKNVTITNMGGGGIWILGTSSGSIFYNNVLYNMPGSGILASAPTNNHTIVHNTIYNMTDPVQKYGIGVSDSATVIKNNLLVQIAGPSIAVSTGIDPGQVSNNACTATQPGCTAIAAVLSPFVNAAAANFQLAVGSAAIGKGALLVAPYHVDKSGVSRSDPFDAGAYEFTTAETPLPTSLAFSQPTLDPLAAMEIFSISVRVLDQGGALYTDTSVSVGLALGANPGGGTLLGTTPQMSSTATGLASFPALQITAPGNGKTLVATASGLPNPSTTTNPFNVTAAPSGPLAPSNLHSTLQTVTATGEEQMAWDYTQGSPLATGFNVYVQAPCPGTVTLRPGMPLPVTTLTHTHSGLALGSTNCWHVRAVDASAGESMPSNTLSWTVPGTVAAPTNLTISTFTTGQFLR